MLRWLSYNWQENGSEVLASTVPLLTIAAVFTICFLVLITPVSWMGRTSQLIFAGIVVAGLAGIVAQDHIVGTGERGGSSPATAGFRA